MALVLISKYVSCGRTVSVLSAILDVDVNVKMKLPEREVQMRPHALPNTQEQIFRIKKKLDGKFSKPSVKNFEI